MAKRKFQLPREEELTKEQDRAIALPEEGQYLIVGAPGTGKSVVALQRVLKLKQKYDNQNYVFLVYNRMLESVTLQLIDSNLVGTTIVSYLYKLYWHLFKENVPQIEPYKPDYDLVVSKIKELDCDVRPLHLIIDEGQDMPPQFYEALQYAGYEHFFIVADQNQRIEAEYNSSREDLTNLLGLDVEDVIELKTNFRNTRPIAALANHFYTDLSSPCPTLPDKDSLEIPTFFDNIDNKDCCEMILREADKDDRNLIGVIVATNKQRSFYMENLTKIELELDNPKPIISTYSSSAKKADIDFSQGGIVILNDKSTKGLEFDIVFIVLDGFCIYNNDMDNMKKRFYVMTSRAIEKLVLLGGDNIKPEIDQLLPTDMNIFKRVSASNNESSRPIQFDDIPF